MIHRSHAFTLIRKENIEPTASAPLLADRLVATTSSVHAAAAQLADGDCTRGVVSNLAMQIAGNATLLRTAEEQGVSAELLTPYPALMERLLGDGRGNESTTGVVGLPAL
ncbi:imine reductase family protein [Streptomyces atratus]|uniref:imine reductase family protein n=1 Tax=Streptomyces atratus TaxID=1893 RepID=UPI00364C2308